MEGQVIAGLKDTMVSPWLNQERLLRSGIPDTNGDQLD